MEQTNQENQVNLDSNQNDFEVFKNKVWDNMLDLRRNIEKKFPAHPDIDDVVSGIISKVRKINNHKHLFLLEFLDGRISEINDLLSKIDMDSDPVEIKYEFHALKYQILDLYDFCGVYVDFSENILREMNEKLSSSYKDLEDKIERFGKLTDVLKNYKTYEVYKKAQIKYRFAYFIYLFLAAVVVCYGLRWSIDLMQSKYQWIEIYKITEYDFWAIKITTIFIIITGVTFCLKQAIHHQKKKDKAEQTRLELEALPTYMFNFSDEQKNEVYKELTGRYFGRDSDNVVYQGMSNIVQ
jgi:hypothetical protein